VSPRAARVVVQRSTPDGWRRLGSVRTDRRGRFAAAVPKSGTYRVKAGPVAGPAVRVR
jgi:hypothetical protein